MALCGTMKPMKTTVQARLDRQSRADLKRLEERLGWNRSRVVREGLRLLAACYGNGSGRKVIGVGRFSSGLPDLGSSKKHLEGFGQ